MTENYNPSNVGVTNEQVFKNMDDHNLNIHLMNAESRLKEQTVIVEIIRKILEERKE